MLMTVESLQKLSTLEDHSKTDKKQNRLYLLRCLANPAFLHQHLAVLEAANLPKQRESQGLCNLTLHSYLDILSVSSEYVVGTLVSAYQLRASYQTFQGFSDKGVVESYFKLESELAIAGLIPE